MSRRRKMFIIKFNENWFFSFNDNIPENEHYLSYNHFDTYLDDLFVPK